VVKLGSGCASKRPAADNTFPRPLESPSKRGRDAARPILARGGCGRYCHAMRDEDDDDPREDRGFTTSNFRRKLGEGLAGLLDPDGAIGRGKEIVTGVTSATKNEVVRMISAEVRQFLDGMDTVDLLQRVVAGLVIDVKAEIRFSVDPDGALKSNIKTDKAVLKSSDPAPTKAAAPPAEARAPARPPAEPKPPPSAGMREPEARAPARPPTETRPPPSAGVRETAAREPAKPKEPAPFKPTNDPRLPPREPGAKEPGSKD
jgi:hypothetical protein